MNQTVVPDLPGANAFLLNGCFLHAFTMLSLCSHHAVALLFERFSVAFDWPLTGLCYGAPPEVRSESYEAGKEHRFYITLKL